MRKLTSLDESALRQQLPGIEDADTRAALEQRVPAEAADPAASIATLAGLMRFARQTVEAKQVSPADRRRLIDLAITAAAVIQQRGMTLLESGKPMSVRQHLELLVALVDAAYGSGLLMEREREAATASLQALLEGRSPTRDRLRQQLGQAARVVEWAQRTTLYAFEEVWAPWAYLLPAVSLLPDDVLRGSPLMVYGRALERLEAHTAGANPIRHELFGESFERDVRALNPGVALGKLRVAPALGDYSREEVLALPETPADLEPAAGILTRGEGNVVSHVQLLARALGIPNAVLGASPYERFVPHQGEEVFYIATPGGRVIVKTASTMTDRDREVLDEYTRNQKRSGDGSLGEAGPKLHIDVERLDIESSAVVDLAAMRRKDSGVRCGPKAAFLGELKHHFPDKVARGIVVPFGAYYAHYRAAPVALPRELAGKGIAKPGEPLEDFVKRSYATFFGEMLAAGKDEREVAAWIRPRLDVIRHSLESHPLSSELREAIRAELERQGLLLAEDSSQTVGLFVRSDTNVEDLESFSGAGLNLTLFNRRSLDDIYEALKLVWASPFTYRSFSWRQTLIDEPLWVLPSVVILESVPTTKSGVLVTADLEGQGPQQDARRHLRRRGRCRRRHARRDARLVAQRRRARDDVQVALPAAAAARRRQRDRAVHGQRDRALRRGARAARRDGRPRPRQVRALPGPGGPAARLGHRVRLRGREALALPDASLHRQRVAQEHLRPRRLRGAGERGRGEGLPGGADPMRRRRLVVLAALLVGVFGAMPGWSGRACAGARPGAPEDPHARRAARLRHLLPALRAHLLHGLRAARCRAGAHPPARGAGKPAADHASCSRTRPCRATPATSRRAATPTARWSTTGGSC